MTNKSRKFIPARPTSPGDVLRNRILPNSNLTQDRLAEALDVSRFSVNQIVNGKRNVTAEMAMRLAQVTNTTAQFWLALQQKIDLYEAELKVGEKIKKLPRLQTTNLDEVTIEDVGEF